MPYEVPLRCPACSSAMNITELTCPTCETRVSGTFSAPGLHRLNAEQLQFVEVFLRCRGNIREVERDLKLSYPTIRSRLDQVIAAMGFQEAAEATATAADAASSRAHDVLEALETGDLTFEEALARIKEDGKK